MYISRIRPHDSDKQRRIYARKRAMQLDGVRGQFIDYCLRTGVPEHEMQKELENLDFLVQTWLDVADQSKVD